ncbi:hypothetical protein MPDQ_007862 [Monascus purpureus]|uniref:Tr-type G domain-containing protein n=1 Tax=Monascus purpureus TaxID=5098 RepID=A0A507R506_MONPU|nr:hypothetical protein MPDQ_007862 [Monascus purpureus]BDD62948.1 hypothetical protein MAP00_007900 [Monascus purpureus]
MASIFTYDPDPPRVSSPWSTSGSSTPHPAATGARDVAVRSRSSTYLGHNDPDYLSDYGITKLEPEPQEGPTEYKLHLLLRPRRLYTSMSTGHLVSGSYHSRASLSSSVPSPSSYETSPRLTSARPQPARSAQSRQQRLQQLTTQLLWRLQQSSPFHSSSTANPVLSGSPEVTPRLGLPPQKPVRLLPGLEESQGALYEIGVADDGTLVGLTPDELEESLTTLQTMAASLGCKVEILRRVVVGTCEWVEEQHTGRENEASKCRAESLWVAEALVTPDLDFYKSSGSFRESSQVRAFQGQSAEERTVFQGDYSSTEQIRVSITGPSTAGKSSLLGTLTTSVLDNGRGKSRLSLLKHRHEISSGITSSVAQELIGYASMPSSSEDVDIINYASSNVAAWDDIHAASNDGRLAFVSDLPGLVRYSKSTLRGLISWAPHYVMLCIPANSDEEITPDASRDAAEQIIGTELCLSYLVLCMKLEVPILVVITKLDVASRAGLKNTLSKVLSTLKVAGKKPLMLHTPGKCSNLHQIQTVDSEEIRKTVTGVQDWLSTVPIVLTSAIDGSGIGKLHALLRYLPIPQHPQLRSISLDKPTLPHYSSSDIFDIDEVFAIPPSKVYSMSAEQRSKGNEGVVLCGLVRYGTISIGDKLVIGPVLVDQQSDQGSLPSQRMRLEQHSPQSLRNRQPSGEFSTSYFHGFHSPKLPTPVHARWQLVQVVSVRNLRLPVRSLTQDQVGTIGIEPVCTPGEGDNPPSLGRVRKGMVLAKFREPSVEKPAAFYTGFVAKFPFSEFSPSVSPPLLLGGNAIVYIANVRATVKVACVTLAEDEVISSPPSPTEPEFFSFDHDIGDLERGQNGGGNGNGNGSVQPELNKVISRSSFNTTREDIWITFSFVSSIEWLEVGSRVLLMPGASMASSTSGDPVALSGLEGFVGRVCDVLAGSGCGEK